jgi:hydrogenase-4 component F
VLHVLNNGLAKGMLFLAVGNVVLATGTSTADEIRGIARRLPGSGALLVVGLFAVTGSPPFGMFISEFSIISAAIGEHHPWVAAVVVALLAIIFVGIAAMILELVYAPEDAASSPVRSGERPKLVAAPAVLGALGLLLGIYLPPRLVDALSSAALTLGGHAP